MAIEFHHTPCDVRHRHQHCHCQCAFCVSGAEAATWSETNHPTLCFAWSSRHQFYRLSWSICPV